VLNSASRRFFRRPLHSSPAHFSPITHNASFVSCCAASQAQRFLLLPDLLSMNLTELKQKPITELLEMAEQMGIDNMARSSKQDVIFSLLKRHAKSGEEISADGVLVILQDGFGFLRSADSSYLAGPNVFYVSPSQIRRFHLLPARRSVG